MRPIKIFLALLISFLFVLLFVGSWMAYGPGIHPQPVGKIELTEFPSQAESINAYFDKISGKKCTHKFIARDRAHLFVEVFCDQRDGELFRLDYDHQLNIITADKGIFGGEGIHEEIKRLVPKKVYDLIQSHKL